MKFKVDENLPVEAAKIFHRAGHDAVTVLDQQLGGEKDKTIAQVCQEERRIILTLDLDFADIRAYPPKEFAGLIVLRPQYQDKHHVLAILEQLVKAIHDESLEQKLWIVEESRIRIRE
jgi:predicted nuclease of predicted toxin-antitoxin system